MEKGRRREGEGGRGSKKEREGGKRRRRKRRDREGQQREGKMGWMHEQKHDKTKA